MTFNKTKLALSIAAATFSMAILAPQAQADSTDATSLKADQLQFQMQQMADQMKAMQAELDRVKASADKAANADSKVQELDQWMASVKHAPEAIGPKDNLVVVRGGWEQLDHARSAGSDLSSALKDGGLLNNNQNPSGFYVGGAFDFNVNNDLFGLVDDTSFMVELGFEYSQYGRGQNSIGLVNAVNGSTTLGGAGLTPGSGTDNRLRLNASPKIKFMHGSRLRPWIIPVGLELNILGVPSNAVSVLNSGMQFGGGLEYDIFRGIVLGTDVRYHYATSKIDGTTTDGVSAGGYVGFKF